MRRAAAVLACAMLASGCFGYNSSAKKWAYVGDTILIVGGAAAITGDIVSKQTDEPCMGTGCPEFSLPFGGATVAGTMLLAAGIVGIVVNATRPTVKQSR